MNIGQVLETHLGWAAAELGYKAATPVFNGATENQIVEQLDKAALPNTGKMELYDGRTGDRFSILDDRDMGYTLGAADYLTKPIERERLIAVLERYCPRGETSRVLVVDDDPEAREMVRRALEKDGWMVSEAADGREGLEALRQARPNAILLDLMMPEMDGFAFVSQLQSDPANRSIPVIVVTAKDITQEDRDRLNGYVQRIIQKSPIGKDEILREVRGLVASATGG
jgi:CheY-like chemotaxis protein